jgi:hypothetical protein
MPELLGASMVNIHSKVIVLDPFGAHPVVMTGSHNLGFKASSQNDDNLVIIENNAPLAAAFAINIVAIFQNYRWNNYVEQNRTNPQVWHGLVDNDSWQSSYLSGTELQELEFWLGQTPVSAPVVIAAAPPAQAAAPRIPVKSAGKTKPKPAVPPPARPPVTHAKAKAASTIPIKSAAKTKAKPATAPARPPVKPAHAKAKTAAPRIPVKSAAKTKRKPAAAKRAAPRKRT